MVTVRMLEWENSGCVQVSLTLIFTVRLIRAGIQGVTVMPEPKRYGLFATNLETGKRERLFPTLAYPKKQAIRVFQSALLDLSFAGRNPELKPVKVESQY